MIQLDLSRRRVAAISFLSNISVEKEPPNEDENLYCLKVSVKFNLFDLFLCQHSKAIKFYRILEF